MTHEFRRWLRVGVVLAFVVPLVAAPQRAADTVLGDALHQAEVIGDYDAAIAGFRSVIVDRSASRTVVAQALLYLGAAQEKLGQPGARTSYERLLREYADVSSIAAEARTRLAALDETQDKNSRVTARQLWAGDDADPWGWPSADGHQYVYTDWSTNTGNLAVRNLETGETRVLTRGPGDAMSPVISPDGKQIAYAWDDNIGSIRVIGTDGSHMRVLVETRGGFAFYLKWSPDGKRIAAVFTEPPDTRSSKIALISVTDGSVTRLKSLGWQAGEIGGFSPDGRYLVYSMSETPTPADRGIYVIAVDGSHESRIVRSSTKEGETAWTPDGRGIVFVSNRSGTQDLWLLRVADGKAQGEPELLRANIGEIINKGFMRDGTFVYGLWNRKSDVYLCDIDPATLAITGPPARLTDRFVGSNTGPTWSPDGRTVAFFRGTDRRAMSLVLRTVAEGEERVVPVKLNDSIHAGRMGATWMPDGRSLLIGDPDYPNNTARIRSVDVQTGTDRVVVESRNAWPQGRVSPDGKYLFYTITEDVTEPAHPANLHLLRLLRRELATGQELELYRAKSDGVAFFNMAVSPDGRELAVAANEGGGRVVMTVPTAGGPRRVLYRGTYTKPSPFGAVWTRDGRFILTGGNGGNPRSMALLAFPAEGASQRCSRSRCRNCSRRMCRPTVEDC